MSLGNDTRPDWTDYYNLNFWLWGCLENAIAYLNASAAYRSVCEKMRTGAGTNAERLSAFRAQDLAKYNFIMTAGSLAKHLDKAGSMFPSIQPLYEKAVHFRIEGLALRNMVEHSLNNIEAARKGTSRGGFVRKTSSLGNELPGSSSGSIDAVSTYIDASGHWLGGRLCVERVINELTPIQDEARALLPAWAQGVFGP